MIRAIKVTLFFILLPIYWPMAMFLKVSYGWWEKLLD